MDITIVSARPHDAGRVLRLLEMMHDESPAQLGAINPVKAMHVILQVIDQGLCVLAMDGKSLAGVIGLLRHRDWWSDDEVLADPFFYVRERYRQSRAAASLLATAHKFAADTGLPLKMGPTAGGDGADDIDRKAKLYERMGLVRAGYVFMPPKPAPEPEPDPEPRED